MTAAIRARPFDSRRFLQLADLLAIGVAVSLPWSTTATGILIALWILAVFLTLTIASIWREIKTPAGGLPVLLWLFGAVGMLWADVSWSERFGGLDGFHRLLIIPLLFAQFRRSDKGELVLYGYLVSAVCLLVTSWAFALIPALQSRGNFPGVPVKDYIFQSSEFLICAFALLGVTAKLAADQNWRAIIAAVGAVLFIANLAFVFTSRTSLVVVPFLVVALGWRLSRIKGIVIACLIAAVLAPMVWFSSSHLRDFTLQSVHEIHDYFNSDTVTSASLHLEFLRKSIGIIEDAPIIGHGTGSIGEEFRHAAEGQSGATAVVTVNPHNQIFAVAIQLGCVGAIVLIAMWVSHLMLFSGGGVISWVGMVVVIENIASSAVNSHLFDFSPGWLYVFGVGVAGGMVLKGQDADTRSKEPNPVGAQI
jgi:O-antigen ligase